ncbi:MAG TPA: SDR family oxidoreductase [Acidimicrobiales bacterium]|nr:SDR family oxidoreductase [Acidimicrobiales bacterium]
MAFDWSGKRVLVTGASSGIGAGLAARLASLGARVGMCARREAELAAVLSTCQATSPDSAMWLCDMAIADEVDSLVSGVLDTFGGVDVLINNAGIPKRRHITKTDQATVENVMRINFLGPSQLTLALLPQMLGRGEGRIVNVSSIAATISSPNEAAYDASKAALAVFSEAMAIDLWDTGIKVMVVYPGVVDTPLFDLPDNDPLPDSAPPKITVDEMVDAILAGVDNDDVEVYAPQWFKDVAIGKAQNPAGFMSGTADWLRQSRA